MEERAEEIKEIIRDTVKNSPDAFRFREPITGFASAEDSLYNHLDKIIGCKQLHPKEILPSAKTVVAYFLPFSLDVIKKIQEQQTIVQEWSESYTVANLLLAKINKRLTGVLNRQGISVVCEPPTGNYNPIHLTAQWAHKASAVIAGIGTFGLNHLVITKSGSAGRLNSLVIDARVAPTMRLKSSYCLYYKTGKCKICIEKCPVGALAVDGFDRFRCNAYLEGKNIHDLQQDCGMCSSGSCATRGFY